MARDSGSWLRPALRQTGGASRIVVVFHGEPAQAERLLPPGARALVVEGRAPVFLCHTRQARERRWLPDRLTHGSDHLSWLVPADFPAGPGAAARRGTLALERATSSWIEARWSERRGRRGSHRAAFRLAEGAFDLELRVEREGVEEVYLRGEPAPASRSALFPTPRALEAFLEACSDLRADGFAPEPLELFELRSAFLEAGPLRGFELDGAFRFVTRRLAPARAAPAARLRSVIEPVSAPALPAP